MKITILMLAITVVALLAALALSRLVDVQRIKTRFVFGVDQTFDFVRKLGGAFREAHLLMANAELGAGIHGEAITKLSAAAITTRHLLYVRGADDQHVTTAGASDALAPMGVIADEAAAAEEEKAVLILGKGPTKRMVASEAITIGDEVWTAASGKVQDRTASAGTYWIVGVALSASSADGDVIEVADHAPVRITIP